MGGRHTYIKKMSSSIENTNFCLPKVKSTNGVLVQEECPKPDTQTKLPKHSGKNKPKPLETQCKTNTIKLSKGERIYRIKTKILHSIKGKEFVSRCFFTHLKINQENQESDKCKYIRSYTTSSFYECI